jgi:putative addiction module component (TIGR02574 family)
MNRDGFRGWGKFEPKPETAYVFPMPITLDQIVEETRHWPPEKVGELVGRLTEDLHATEPEIEVAWKAEIDRRIEEIQSGKVQAISAEEVSARIDRILGR